MLPPPDSKWIGHAPSAGFIQDIDVEGLVAVAEQNGLIISLAGEIGTYCLPGEAIVEAWPETNVTASIANTIIKYVRLGKERTPAQDVDFGFRRVADIMLKALSPAINDPTTAEYSINWLCELVVLLASVNPDEFNIVSDDNGQARVVLATREFERSVRTAFGQLRFYVRNDTSLILYSLEVFRRTAALVGPRHQPVVLAIANEFVHSVIPSIADSKDRATLESASAWIFEHTTSQAEVIPSVPTSA